MHLRFGLLITLCATGYSCTPTPRDLTWEIVFAPGVDAARATRVETRILAGGCDGSADLYVANVDPASPEGPMPSVLSPGRYGFAATAWSADCVSYAEDCQDYTLPTAEGETILLELSDTMASAACPAPRCIAGTCQDQAVDGGADVDAMPDTGVDAGPPPGPLIIGQGLPAASSQMIDLTAGAVMVASGTSSFTQNGTAGGWVSSRLLVDGLMLGGTVTTRRGLDGNELNAGSTLVAPVSGDPFVLSHARDAAGYDFVSERWAWGAIAASEVVSGGHRDDSEVAEISVTTTEEVIAIVNGVTGAITTRAGAGINMVLDVDGVPCGRSTQNDDDGISVPGIGASFFCLAAIAPGSHVLGARATAANVSSIGTEIDYVFMPRARVTPFGTSGAGSESVVLPGAGVLVAFAWHRFTGTGGWGQVAVRVDGSTCARSRTETAPSDLTVGCVWPVAGSATVNLEVIGSGEGTTPTTATLGWAFLSSAPP